MNECTVCISYIFEIRDAREPDVANDWLRHTESMHRSDVGTVRYAQTIVDLLEWTRSVREALDV